MVQASRRKFHVLYKTTCLVTGRYYIGIHSTDNLEDRYLGSGIHLTRSVKKYGRDKHIRETLELVESRALLKIREEEVVTEDLIKSDVMCMNLIKGGNSNDREFGITDKTRELLSIASKNAERTPEWRENISKSLIGKSPSEESKLKRKEKYRQGPKRTLTEDHKANIGIGLTGREVSDETRRKIADGIQRNKDAGLRKKNGPMDDDHKQKLREAQTGRKYSDESRALMSMKAKARGANTGRQCAIGDETFASIKECLRQRGKGKNGLKHPEFRVL